MSLSLYVFLLDTLLLLRFVSSMQNHIPLYTYLALLLLHLVHSILLMFLLLLHILRFHQLVLLFLYLYPLFLSILHIMLLPVYILLLQILLPHLFSFIIWSSPYLTLSSLIALVASTPPLPSYLIVYSHGFQSATNVTSELSIDDIVDIFTPAL